ncbi:hypothetical protein P5V15_013625 [Pogonomyrmex californicus]
MNIALLTRSPYPHGPRTHWHPGSPPPARYRAAQRRVLSLSPSISLFPSLSPFALLIALCLFLFPCSSLFPVCLVDDRNSRASVNRDGRELKDGRRRRHRRHLKDFPPG